MAVILDDIKKQAADGRGLYVSVPVAHGWAGDLGRFMGPDPHMTVIHFGKKNDGDRVEKILSAVKSALDDTDMRKGPLNVELTGVGFLYQKDRPPTPVVLVNSYAVCAFRDALLSHLSSEGVETSRYFGFIPHVSLDLQESYSTQDVAMALIPGRKAQCFSPGVFLVCGTERLLLTDAPVF